LTERPLSENLSNSLAIPKPHYSRQHSSSAINNPTNTSPSDSSISSDNNSGQWLLPTPPSTAGSTPKTPRAYSSRQKPLSFASANRSPRTPFANSEWERERWRQWELLAKENVDDKYEKETLV
jgi:hypothetical protein